MNQNKLFLIFPIMILIIGLISAGGLTIIGNTNFEVNKSLDVDENIILQISNDYSQTMYNISFEDNEYIYMETIESISPGETKNISATIYTNLFVEEPLSIMGFYESNIGSGTDTYDIQVNYEENGISDCQKTIVKGDTVTWYNHVNDPIKMVNSDNNEVILQIPFNSSHTMNMDTPRILNYHFERYGFKFAQFCSITTLNDKGVVHDPNLDAVINLKVTPQYDPTNIDVVFLQSSYTLDAYESDQGMFQITNTGENIAKNIKLNGEWFTFSKNNFDLEPGKSQTLSYTILPEPTDTSETNKTHYKEINIRGNFPTYVKNMSIFVNYVEITNSSYSGGKSIIEVLEEYCADYPNHEFCGNGKIIYQGSNSSSGNFNVTYNQEQVMGIYAKLFEFMDSEQVDDNFLKETIALIQEQLNKNAVNLQNVTAELNQVRQEKSSENSALITILAIISICSFGGLVVVTVKKIKDKRKKGDTFGDV